ncbi:MAG: type II toxin-antitoxin system RelE/ParE family toxin [Defluviitaleaceae bacterium]|nr:type II toxin-antitoxin system RelE/ParE family toxin [Defluviitaleaceae bacterium]
MDEKRYKYEFSPLAVDDLTEIFEYIALASSSIQIAENLIDEMQTAVENLCDFPFSHPLVKDSILRKKGYRLLVVKNYNIFYVVKEKRIIIRRVLHGKRNFEGSL